MANTFMEHPISLDSSPAERRALKFKVFTFYGKWEPTKSVQDVNDLVEWALGNGVAVFNNKLKSKYGEDLSSVSLSSYLDLPLLTQLKLFYSEFDANKKPQDIEAVNLFATNHGPNGLSEINSKMNQKYGENLNTLAFGGRHHMRIILDAYFKQVDPFRASAENINITIEYVVHNGALALIRELMERYKVPLQLSVKEIHGKAHEIDINPLEAQKQEQFGASRPAVMSLMRGSGPPVTLSPAPVQMRPLSMALSNKGTGATPYAGAMSVSQDAEIKGLMEVFYAKNNPEKLASGGVDALMRFCRIYGFHAVNEKLREKYDEDLDTLKAQYEVLVVTLTEFYKEVDPTKKNIEDIAAWAIVHGQQPLSDRLKKRYGKGLFEEAAPPPPAAVAAASVPTEVVAEKLNQTTTTTNPLLSNLPPPPTPPQLMTSPRVMSSTVDSEMLRLKLQIFYKQFDSSKPKSEEDINTIVNWVLSGSSIPQLNKKLKDKYGKSLDDVETPVLKTTTSAVRVQSTLPMPEEIQSTLAPVSNKSSFSTGSASPPTNKPSKNLVEKAKEQFRSRSDSLSSDAGSMDGMEEQMNNMRRITSGQYEQLGKQIRAFYRRYDTSKLDNKEALDMVMKWTFKHGPEELNKQFEKNYGKSLFSVVVDETDLELEEAEDVVNLEVPDW